MFYTESEDDPLILYSKVFNIEEKYLNKNISVEEARKLEEDWRYYSNFHMGPHQNLFDRSGHMPHHLEIKNLYPFPNLSITKIKTYRECCMERATELIEYSKSSGRKIRLMWSGGLDSTCALCSLLMCGIDLDQLEVIMSYSSIVEYPWFYYNVIKKLNINHKWHFMDMHAKHYLAQTESNSPIIVMGEPNDDFFQGNFAVNLLLKNMELIDKPYEKVVSRRVVEFTKPAIENFPTKIKTFSDYASFYMFTMVTQWCMTRFSVNCQLNIIGFFCTDDFQRWSLFTDEPKILNSITTYKLPVKKVILEYTKDEDYFLNKSKNPSSFSPNYGNGWQADSSVFRSKEGYYYSRKTIDKKHHIDVNLAVKV